MYVCVGMREIILTVLSIESTNSSQCTLFSELYMMFVE